MKFLLAFWLFSIPTLVLADSWEPPKTKRYFSANGQYFIEIVPTKIPEKYSQWRMATPKRKAKFKPTDTTIIPCHARFFKIQDKDTIKLWEQKLINHISPMTALVSNDGAYVVTFDNWASLGYGLDVMVVYNAKGELLKRYQLDDFSPFPLNAYQLSISSIWWRCGASFASDRELKICFLTDNKQQAYKTYDLAKFQFDAIPVIEPEK